MRNPDSGVLSHGDGLAVDVLGGAIIRGDARLVVTSQQRAIVMALAMHPGGLSSERLVDLVYSDASPASERCAIKVHVYRLRRRISLDLIATQGSVYTLGPSIDLLLPADASLELSSSHLRPLRLDEIESLCRYARALRSPVPVGLEYYDWYVGFVARYQQAGRNLALSLSRELVARGHYPEAIQIATELTREDPCDEEAWEEVIRCHLSQGQRSAAVQGFRFLRAALQRDLGIPPSRSLLKLLL
jgi:DNA-binding SARP family transcriptional activator